MLFNKTIFVLCLFASLNPASADTVSYEQIFSKDVFKGGLPCASLSDAYLEKPVVAFSKADLKEKQKEPVKLKPACVQGGGDCVCFSLYLESIPSVDSKMFYKIRDLNNRDIWVLTEKKNERAISVLATEEMGEIHFRNPAPELFLDEGLHQAITKEDLNKIPEGIFNKIPKKNTEQFILLRFIDVKNVNSKNYSHLRVFLKTWDPEDDEWIDNFTKRKSEIILPLRDVWVKTFDDLNRINFWLDVPPGC